MNKYQRRKHINIMTMLKMWDNYMTAKRLYGRHYRNLAFWHRFKYDRDGNVLINKREVMGQ